MLGKIIFHIAAGVLGIWLAATYVNGVTFSGPWKDLFLAGAAMGLINFFIGPLLRAVTLPLRIITLGLFSLLINMFLVWLVDLFFGPEFEIKGFVALFWTTAIIWLFNFFFGLYSNKNKPAGALTR